MLKTIGYNKLAGFAIICQLVYPWSLSVKLLLSIFIILFSINSLSIEVNQIIDQTSFKSAVQLHENGEIPKALKVLENLEIAADKEAYRYFLMSKYAFELSYYKKARKYIDKSIEYKVPIQDYAYFMKGLIEWEARENLDSAEANFKIALQKNPIRSLANDINFYLAKVHFAQKKYDESLALFAKIRRPYRNHKRQPEIVWNLVNLYSITEDRVNMCRWTRKLYSSYPFSKFVDHWNINLAANKVQSQPTNCNPTYYEKKRRIKKLLWAGKDQQAKKDIDLLKKSIKPISASSVDKKLLRKRNDVESLLAEYHLHIGNVNEALAVLLNDHKNKKDDFEYLMLLGYASFKAGQYQTAVGSYHKAFKMKPNHPRGKTALFRSAFLSYQFQDYDGATRKFKQFIATYPGSTLNKDAQYHIAWMKYLRGNYRSAIKGFESILAKRKQSRRGWRKYPVHRIQYWLGMSYLKLKEKEVARHIFEYLRNDPKKGYYSFASNSRLKQLGPKPIMNDSTEGSPLRSLSSTNANLGSLLTRAQLNIDEDNDIVSDDNEKVHDEETEIKTASHFWSKPKIFNNINRVEALIGMGQVSWAYRDLKLIETHIRDASLYKGFIKNYQALKKYTRASYLTEIKLFPQYSDKQLSTDKSLWKSAYPLAFKNHVVKYSSSFAVPKTFVWSIMKAESRYNPEAESPVGAKGLMQLMPYTAVEVAKLLGESEENSLYLKEPKTNIKLGTRYLSRLLGKFNQQIPLAAAAYNAGPHRVVSWLSKFGNLELDEFIEHIPFVETRNYVKRVTRYYGSYNMAYYNNNRPMDFLANNIPVKISGPVPTKEDWN